MSKKKQKEVEVQDEKVIPTPMSKGKPKKVEAGDDKVKQTEALVDDEVLEDLTLSHDVPKENKEIEITEKQAKILNDPNISGWRRKKTLQEIYGAKLY